MAIEGLVRDIATLEGQRAAAPGQIFSGLTKGIQSGVKAVGEDLREAEWQKQLELGKQGVLDMAKQVGLDENRIKMLNTAMTGKSGVDRESMNKMYVLLHNMKTEKDKADKIQAEQKGIFGAATEFERQQVPEGLTEAQREQFEIDETQRRRMGVLEKVETPEGLKLAQGIEKFLQAEQAGMTANQKALRSEFWARYNQKLKEKEAGVIKQAGEKLDSYAGLGTVINELNKELTEENFSTFVNALNPSIANTLQKGLESITDADLDFIAKAESTSDIQSLMAQMLLVSMKNIKGAASDRDVQIVANSLANPTVADYRKTRNAIFRLVQKLESEHGLAVTAIKEQSDLFTGRTSKLLNVPLEDGGFKVDFKFDAVEDFGQKEGDKKITPPEDDTKKPLEIPITGGASKTGDPLKDAFSLFEEKKGK